MSRKAAFDLAAVLPGIPAAVAWPDARVAVWPYPAELSVMLLVFLAALGSPERSERAFRLLRWMTGRPRTAPPARPPPTPLSRTGPSTR
jgi:hypothetical protein